MRRIAICLLVVAASASVLTSCVGFDPGMRLACAITGMPPDASHPTRWYDETNPRSFALQTDCPGNPDDVLASGKYWGLGSNTDEPAGTTCGFARPLAFKITENGTSPLQFKMFRDGDGYAAEMAIRDNPCAPGSEISFDMYNPSAMSLNGLRTFHELRVVNMSGIAHVSARLYMSVDTDNDGVSERYGLGVGLASVGTDPRSADFKRSHPNTPGIAYQGGTDRSGNHSASVYGSYFGLPAPCVGSSCAYTRVALDWNRYLDHLHATMPNVWPGFWERRSNVTAYVAIEVQTYDTAGRIRIQHRNWVMDDATNDPPPPPSSCSASASGYQVVFQAPSTELWTAGVGGTTGRGLGMMAGTSPSVTTLTGGGTAIAFQANTTELWTAGSIGTRGLGLGMLSGTSPAITAMANNGYAIAYQANTTELWTAGSIGTRGLGLGMMAGTSPGITRLSGGGYQIAFQANTGELWTTGTMGTRPLGLGMAPGTSPAITGLPNNGFQIVFHANTGELWSTIPDVWTGSLNLGMAPNTSPAIATRGDSSTAITFQANTGELWTADRSGVRGVGLGMMPGTSPAITALANNSYQVAFHANTGQLWTTGPSTGPCNWALSMQAATSPAVTRA